MKIEGLRSVFVCKKLFRDILIFCLNKAGFRFGLINQSALGHLTFDTEVNFLETKSIERRRRDGWYLIGDTTNETISNFWKKELKANRNRLRLISYSAIDSSNQFKHMLLSRPIGAGDGDVLDRYPSSFRFSADQSVDAKRILNEFPFNPEDRLVLFCLRDNSYYRDKRDLKNVAIHSHRNVDVQAYKPAIDFLISKGFSVVRMGRVAESAIEIENAKFVDLPFHEAFSVSSLGLQNRELLELALFEKCQFVISSGLGTDSLATLFRKRVYYSDYYSVYNLYSSKLFPAFLPKGYFNTKTKQLFTADEVFRGEFLQCQTADEFRAHGVELLNCTSQQICEFISDIYNLESGINAGEFSKLSQFHRETLSKGIFSEKHIPQISDRWANFSEETLKL